MHHSQYLNYAHFSLCERILQTNLEHANNTIFTAIEKNPRQAITTHPTADPCVTGDPQTDFVYGYGLIKRRVHFS